MSSKSRKQTPSKQLASLASERSSARKQDSQKKEKLCTEFLSPRERADRETQQYLLKVRNRMARANKAVK